MSGLKCITQDAVMQTQVEGSDFSLGGLREACLSQDLNEVGEDLRDAFQGDNSTITKGLEAEICLACSRNKRDLVK